MNVYSEQVALTESVKYFDGDVLAATTWINKYALRNEKGELLECTPADMHHRLASEIARIESKYPNPVLTEDILFKLFDRFKYVIPGGSSMSGIGNNYKYTSLSNCFVIEPPCDSYGGIFRADQELVQLMKRRGGVGTDLSYLRPETAEVTNDAKTSSGLVSFMERYSNSTKEVAQRGRRGALMLSCSIVHPDAEGFIDAKLEQGKVTGANISIKLTEEFMKAVKDHQHFLQKFPITEDDWDLVDFYDDPSNCHALNGKQLELGKLYKGKKPGTYVRLINAHKLWMKIINNSWRSAEPGVLFWSNILKESPADFYKDYQTVSTNPCGEIPLCPYDSCRLIAINLLSFVNKPFIEGASIDFDKLSEVAYQTQRIMDDIMDLEIEHVSEIIKKIQSDPEDDNTKRVELELWNKILRKTTNGRRTGVGITAEGDMLAALRIPYGSLKAKEICELVHKTIATNCYMASIDMAKERGAFVEWSPNEIKVVDGQSQFIRRIMNELPSKYQRKWKEFGRRNISMLTIAPTGTVSLMTQTTSGIEPLFKAWYIRRRKTSDKSKAVFTDQTGDMFEEFKVFHPQFVKWYLKCYIVAEVSSHMTTEDAINRLNSMDDETLNKIYRQSPWFNSTAQDVDWVSKVQLQGIVQKWVDHSISCTVNIPKETSVETVANIYMAAYEAGCKGCTIYRDGSRDGVLITETKKKDNKEKLPGLNSPRPDELPAQIIRFKNGNENWIAFIGLMNETPYECFCGKVDDDIRYLPKSITRGKIIRVATGPAVDGKIPHRYDFQYEIAYGYQNTLPAISSVFNSEYWNYARFISGMLRAGVPVDQVINVLGGLTTSDMGDTINTWKRGVMRAMRQFVTDGVKSGSKCPKCGTDLVYQGGCQICPACGDTKCE